MRRSPLGKGGREAAGVGPPNNCHSDCNWIPAFAGKKKSSLGKGGREAAGVGSSIPYSRVQIGVNQVDHEIEQHHPGGEKEVDSGDQRVVSVIEGIHQETPDPRQVEDVLHDHGASHQDRQLQAYERHYRDEGILDGVSDDDDPLLESLGPGGPDVVLPEHLQHHGARHPHGGRSQVGPQNEAGHDEHGDIAQRVCAKRHDRQRWRPGPPDGRKCQDQRCQPEVGRRQADDGDRPPHVVGGRIAVHRRVDADRQPDQQPDQDRHHSQLHRCR